MYGMMVHRSVAYCTLHVAWTYVHVSYIESAWLKGVWCLLASTIECRVVLPCLVKMAASLETTICCSREYTRENLF